MAQGSDINAGNQENVANSDTIQLQISNNKVDLPQGHFIGDADMAREGQDLVLTFSDDSSYNVPQYFTSNEDLLIEDSSGAVLTSGLINSFMHSSPEYAQMGTLSDASPVGAIEELKGEATVTRVNGTSEEVSLGTPIYEGDVLQTSGDGAVNIMFMDETTMAISENARVAIDNYSFDASTESGETDISVLRGVFVYTSGLIGRDDPDDVEINTPVGSIGIRGTIIAGNINPEGESEISVLEGAIVITNGSGERTLSQQFETVKLSGFQNEIEYKGVEAANDIGKTYGSVSDVLPKLFSSINDAAAEEAKAEPTDNTEGQNEEIEASDETVDETSDDQDPTSELELETIEDGLNLEGVEQNVKIATDDTSEAIELSLDETSERNIQNKTETLKDLEFQGRKEFELKRTEETVTTEPSIGTINGAIKPVFEQSDASDNLVVADLTLNGYDAGTILTFVSTGTNMSDNGHYEIIQNGGTNDYQIILRTNTGVAGSATLDDLSVQAELGGTVLNSRVAAPKTIEDAVVNLDTAGGYDRNTGTRAAPSNFTAVKDFDGDRDFNNPAGTTDFVHINASNEVVFSNQITGGNWYTLSDHNYDSVASFGDINNDGYTDVIAGSSTAGAGGTSGKISIIEGNADPTMPNITYKAYGSALNDRLGESVDTAGDFNGGSKSDFVIGSTGYNVTGGASSQEGRVIVQYGPSTENLIIEGKLGEVGFGNTVHGIGDFNGDGYSDIMATSKSNTAYIVFGGENPNGETINAADLESGPRGFKIETGGANLVAAGEVGDINGDGYDDIAVSLDTGSAINTYVIYGISNADRTALGGNYQIDDLENPNHALKINHVGGNAAAYEITALGDIDGDGFDDLQVGNAGQTQYLVSGAAGGNTDKITTDSTTATQDYESLVGDTDLNDGGQNFVRLKGGESDNNFEISASRFAVDPSQAAGGTASLDGGKGTDKIVLLGNSGALDFSNAQFEQIEQMEVITFGGDNQTITLTAENIFNILKTSDNQSLRIDNFEGGTSTLRLDDTGTVAGVTIFDRVEDALNNEGIGAENVANTSINIAADGDPVNNQDYTTYKIGGYELYIDTDIAVDVF